MINQSFANKSSCTGYKNNIHLPKLKMRPLRRISITLWE
jgi:hypothetical protein